MKSLLFIYPKPEFDKKARFGYSLNLLYLAAIAKEYSHNVVAFMDYSLTDYSEKDLNFNANKSDYIIIELDAFSLKRSSNAELAEEFIKSLKEEYPNKIIIAFGYDLNLLPRKIDFADFSFSEEFVEENLFKILGEKQIVDYKKDTSSFDKLPFPSRELLSNHIEYGGSLSHSANLAKSTIIQTSRGCLNSCTFCQRQGWQNKYLTHSVEYVISEFIELKKNNYTNIWIADDNFTFDLKRAKKILKELIRCKVSENMKISCSSWTKIDNEFLDLAKSANVSIISFGIESANEDILEFYNKKIDLQNTKKLIKYADKIGLYTVGNFIIGAPMETDKSIEKTFDYALKVPFDQVNIKTLDYMAGSKLFETLSDNVRKNKRHLFACKENNLNKFTIDTIKNKIIKFKIEFMKNREDQIKLKLIKYGFPYKKH